MENIAYEKLVLPNGLEVILHQDRSSPLVSVNMWYHVGSKDEAPGKTGFAHLFEHVMFEGSKHHNRSFFEPLQKVGASLNGSTTWDRTNYWENLPPNYLELALWLESDRMGFLLEALDQRRFDIQRDVVKNERRQSYENRPYGMAWIRLREAAYPLPHPYHWPTIGSQEDLDRASLDDVHSFFRRFYGAGNASLAIAGDIDLDEARDLVERYFGDIPSGPALPRMAHAESPLRGRLSLSLYDRVSLPRVYLAWPGVPRFHPDEAPLSLLALVLGDGKTSRLHRTLVHEQQIAQSVSAYQIAAEIAGDFQVEATAAVGHPIAKVEAAALSEIERLRREPPTLEELARAKNRTEWRNAQQLANIGGFGGRANQLNAFNIFAGDPGLINTDVERFLAVTPEDVQRVAQTYLTGRHVQMMVHPEPVRSHHPAPMIDRAARPASASSRPFVPPLPQRHRLANGLELLVVEKTGLPVVAFALVLRSGTTADPVALPGLSAFTTAMLEEGTTSRSSQQISAEFEFIGSHLSTMAGREHTVLSAETLTRHWPKALEVIADLVQNPTFPEDELARIRMERLTNLQRVRDDPTALAGRVAPMLVYGRETPYGHPGFGTPESLAALSRDDLVRHFRRSCSPEAATLIVVGDVSLMEAVRLAETHLGGWTSGNGQRRDSEAAEPVSPPALSTTLYLLDKPGAPQSVIRSGQATIPRKHPDYWGLLLANHVFGGQFTARLNMNLRQDKGFSYGYPSWVEWHRQSSALMMGGSVHTGATSQALQETLKEYRGIWGERPVTEAELEGSKTTLRQQFPAAFETPWQVRDQLIDLVAFDLPDDYHRTWLANIQAVSLADVRRTAAEQLDPERLTVLVVGDRSQVEPGLGDLGLPIRHVGDDGLAL
jgi:zinc protease